MASRMAQPASTRSARSAPMQGLAARSSKLMAMSSADDSRHFAVGQPAAVDAPAVIALEPQKHAGDRRDRAGRAEHVKIGEIAAVRVCELLHERGDLVDHRVIDVARHRGAAVTLGERDDADRQRGPADDLRLRRSAASAVRPAEPHQLGRAAADIEQDDAASGRIEQLGATGRRQSRLGRRIDDFEFEAGLVGDAGAELLAILGRAAGRGGDQPGAHHAARAHLVAADQQRLDRALDRRLADPPRSGNAFAEANDAGKRVDDAKAVGGRACDQEPAIVGAEIERRVGCIVVWVQRRSHFIAESAVAADAVGCPAGPAGPPSRRPVPAAVAARPGLLVHSIPSCRAGT